MQHPTRTLLAATLPILAAVLATTLAGCNHDNPGTSVQVALDYDGNLGLDIAEVTLIDRTQTAPIERELLLLVPDELAGTDMPIEVWGLRSNKRSAYGTVTTVPKRGQTIKVSLTLTTCSPACQNDVLTTCTGPMVTCPLSCAESGEPHCIGPKPSNGVDPGLAASLRGTTTISAATTLNTDTGAITGDISRATGTGIDGGIGYFQAPAISAGGAPLGIFVFHNLTVDATATLRFTGTRAAVLLVGDAAKIAGTIDVAAGHGTQSTPGPGGGAGGTETGPAKGCGPGGAGAKDTSLPDHDSGGGGGGGGQDGGPGGMPTGTIRGAVGNACLPAKLEPLQGGSGGGRGSPGGAVSGANGGGGGGALQITALGSLEITGLINAGGAGGEGGPAAANNAGAGGGGGSGGALLFEAPSVIVSDKAILTAHGGGGGGGGSEPTGTTAGMQGENGTTSLLTPNGGGGQGSNNGGGSGGAVGPPDVGGDGNSNGGGGGGGVGVIVIRGRTKMLVNGAKISPPAGLLDVQPSM